MKTISTQLSHFFESKELGRNLPLLLRTIALLVVIIAVFTVAFHFVMLYEGQNHSWITGLYWTLTVMSTLGFGDITFTSDLGRFFSVVVLVTGIMMLLVVLPFAFIRFFYAPWLKSQIQNRAPSVVPPDVDDHVIICGRDAIAPELIEVLNREEIPYVIVGPDPPTASDWITEGLAAVQGDLDDEATYENLRAREARMLVANRDDVENTSICLTARAAAPDLPIVAIANDENAVDILEGGGATEVLPLKIWLGQQLANRVRAHQSGLQLIGEYGDLEIAELPARNTPLSGKTVRETGLRRDWGVHIIGIWERGPLHPPNPSYELTEHSVPVVMGTRPKLRRLHESFVDTETDSEPVVVIGGGRVGEAAVRSLHQSDVPVHLVEMDPDRCERLRPLCEEVYQGDASNYDVIRDAGIEDAPSVLLTTNDDAVNVYLASYCRNLNPETRVVSRITKTRNLEGMYRAGADYVLSYTTLGVDAIMSVLTGQELLVLGEGVDLFARPVPESLHHQTLPETEIGAMTGLTVVAVQQEGTVLAEFDPNTELEPEMELLLIGSEDQLDKFVERYE